jgi:hypothetical protein
MGQQTVIDLADLDKVNNITWRTIGTADGWFYAGTEINGQSVYLHTYLLDCKGVIHIDHDTLNNRRSNLRVATKGQIAQHRMKRSNNTSGFIGVNWHHGILKWRARITAGGTRLHLGYFDDPVEAARVYDRAAIKYHSEFAVLNFPDEKHNNSESYHDREISVTELGIPKYVAATDASVAGVGVSSEGRCGTLTKMALALENLSGLEGGANGSN